MNIEAMQSEIREFRLPEYETIPDVGLFLEQTVKYINSYLEMLDGVTLSSSMVSNYVKQKIIANPVKKQYNREQIAYLFFIALTKPVLSLDDITLLFSLEKDRASCRAFYEYFSKELRAQLFKLFSIEDNDSSESEQDRELLRNTITAAVHKIYLDKYFAHCRKAD